MRWGANQNPKTQVLCAPLRQKLQARRYEIPEWYVATISNSQQSSISIYWLLVSVNAFHA